MTTHNTVAAYRAKALEALDLARQARNEGRDAAHSGYMSEALFWRAQADAIARGAHRTTQHA